MWLQAGASPRTSKLRCHIDLRTSDPVAELDRLLGLGRAPAPKVAPTPVTKESA